MSDLAAPFFIVLANLAVLGWTWFFTLSVDAQRKLLATRAKATPPKGSWDVLLVPGKHYLVVLPEGVVAREGDCRDCRHLKGYVNWWCKNKRAEEKFGTKRPGRHDCEFWEEAHRIQ